MVEEIELDFTVSLAMPSNDKQLLLNHDKSICRNCFLSRGLNYQNNN